MSALLAETFGVEPVIRETVQERIYGELKKLLMQGRFQPGQALKIAEVASVFGTSIQPVREAIRQLTAERALEALPNRSARVPVWDRARLDDLHKARIAIEGMTAEMAAARATPADFTRLTAILEAEIDADDANRVEASVAQNREFHFTLYRLSGETGGHAIVNTNDLARGLEKVVRDASHYYLLGYAPSRELNDGKFHKIAVKVKRKGAKSVARRGYYAPSTDEMTPTVAAETVAALLEQR